MAGSDNSNPGASQAASSTTIDPASPRQLLVRRLRADKLRSICREEPLPFADFGTQSSYALMGGLGLGLTFVLADWLELQLLGWLVLVLLSLGVVALIGQSSPGLAAILVALVWGGLVIGQISEGQGTDFMVTVLLPFVLSTAAVWVLLGRRLTTVARSAPLLLPVTLIVLVTPLLSEDVWEVADSIGGVELAGLAGLTILPLLAVFVNNLRQEVPRELREATDEASRDPSAETRAVERAIALVDDRERSSKRPALEATLKPIFSAGFARTTLDTLAAQMVRPIKRQLGGRAVTTVAGLLIAVSGYLYLLGWALISESVARQWLGHEIPFETASFPVGDVDFPTGPYIAVAALLGVLATAVLIAFVVTEERYGRAFKDAST